MNSCASPATRIPAMVTGSQPSRLLLKTILSRRSLTFYASARTSTLLTISKLPSAAAFCDGWRCATFKTRPIISRSCVDDDEVQDLYQDFLIRVTQFFRDPEAFEALKEKVFPAIVDGRPSGSAMRIWVAGCSTGEEVYSLAIGLLEYLDERTANLMVKILATDLNEQALEKARSGFTSTISKSTSRRSGCGGFSSGTTAIIRSARPFASCVCFRGTT